MRSGTDGGTKNFATLHVLMRPGIPCQTGDMSRKSFMSMIVRTSCDNDTTFFKKGAISDLGYDCSVVEVRVLRRCEFRISRFTNCVDAAVYGYP